MPKNAKLYSVTNSSTPKRCELPTLISEVEKYAIKELSKVLAEVFDRADDTLFEMADRAVSNSEQNLYFESMREIRIRRRGLESGFKQAVENNFFALVSELSRDLDQDQASNDDCSLENMSIMKNDDLEETVAVNSMISKFTNATSVETGKLNYRLESLLSGIKVDDQSNPLGAKKLVHSFTDMDAISDLEIKTKLILYKLFDAHVLGAAVNVAAGANKIFVDAGVLPELKAFSSRAAKKTSSSANQEQSGLEDTALDDCALDDGALDNGVLDDSALGGNEWLDDQCVDQGMSSEQASHGRGSGPNRAYGASSNAHAGTGAGRAYQGNTDALNGGPPSIFETIQELLSFSRTSRAKAGHEASTSMGGFPQGESAGGSEHFAEIGGESGGRPVPQPKLMAMLSAVQQSYQQHRRKGEIGNSFVDIQQELGRILKGQEEKRGRFRINQNDDDVINVVGMMFNVILEDENLSDTMKAIIGRLQIPLVKVALLDHSFFSQSSHPARKLLNVLAKAGVGCVDENNASRDAVFCKIQSVVQEVLDHGDGDAGLYESLLSEFDLYIKKEEKRSALIERRIIDAEAGRAKTDQARADVNVAVQSLMAEKEIPPVVLKLVKGAWANVLFVTLLKEGSGSELWQQKLSTASDLIWSVQADSAVKSKPRLLAMVPQLLIDLREGLTEISFNPCEMSQLFSELQALHLYLLNDGGQGESSFNEPLGSFQSGSRDLERSADKSRTPSQSANEPLLSSDSVQSGLSAKKTAASEEVFTGQKSIADITKEIIEKSLSRPRNSQESQSNAELASVNESRRASGGVSAIGKSAVSSLAANPSVVNPSVVNPPVVNAKTSSARPAIKPALDTKGADPASTSSNDERAESEAQYLEQYQQLDRMGVGSWVEFMAVDGSKTRCKLAAKISAQKKFIFVNRSGVKIIERLHYELAQLLKNGQFVVLDDSGLFDRALESVISNLRGNHPNPDSRVG